MPRLTARRREREHGQVVVIFALALVAILAAAGLAFDVGRFYSERRFLQNAADAAALAAGNALVRGESTMEADAEARDILTRNFLADPTGSNPQLPPTTPVYATGHAGDPVYLSNGILISGGDVRVAVQADVGYTFGRAVGLGSNVIVAQARVRTVGDMLPVAVRHYVNAPGPRSGAVSPVAGRSDFQDLVATEDTACLGTATKAPPRTMPSSGDRFSGATPDSDSAHHGPIISIVGDDAKPSNNASFRGFVALDIRNFQSDVPASTVYYNGVTSGTQPTCSRAWRPGGSRPAIRARISRRRPRPQIQTTRSPSWTATRRASSSTPSPSATARRRGAVCGLLGHDDDHPDFALTVPTSVSINATQNRNGAVTMSLSANAAFGNGQVTSSAFTDWGDPTNPLTLGGLAPLTFSGESGRRARDDHLELVPAPRAPQPASTRSGSRATRRAPTSRTTTTRWRSTSADVTQDFTFERQRQSLLDDSRPAARTSNSITFSTTNKATGTSQVRCISPSKAVPATPAGRCRRGSVRRRSARTISPFQPG